MIVFWILTAGLAGLALLFVIPPLLTGRRNARSIDENQVNLAVFRQQMEELDADLNAGNLDQAQYEAARRDLEKELLLDIEDTAPESSTDHSGRWAALVLGPALPALAFAIYLAVGDHGAIERLQAALPPAAAAAPHAQGGEGIASLDVLVAKLAERMQNEPDNLDGWIMLGRSYLAVNDPTKAVEAYDNALGLAPENPDVMLGYAEALARAQGGVDGKPAELISAALQLAPDNPNALWMMGLVEFQRGESATALQHWTRLSGMVQPGSEDAATLQGYIAQAREQAGPSVEEPPPPAAAPALTGGEDQAASAPAAKPQAEASSDSAAGGTSVQVQVQIADDLTARITPQDTVFVFARALNGPPMPLAVQRRQAKDLPFGLTLDDSMAMMPQMSLSAFPEVVVGARVSASGNATPQSGDLEGEVQPVRPGQGEPVMVVIDSVRP
jgi:cytochrome c-type biogenesis protein CcmH